jgi:hypothetical protein
MDVVMGTQGDYSGTNAPSLIRRMGPIGKIVTQFRKFQLIQITILLNLMGNVYDGQGPVSRAVAARQLGFLMGTNFAVGGLLAMPAINLAGLVFNAFGGADEPDDIEQQIRQWAGDPDLADLILKGFPTVIDQDWSGKLGWGTTFSVMPFTDFEISRDGLTRTFAALAGGPTLALAGNMAEGVNQMMQGNVASGAVELMPRGLRDMGRAYNLAAKGVQDKSPMQRQLIEAEDITGYQVMSQFIGLPTADLNRVRSVSRGSRKADRFYDDRLTSLKAEYYEAHKNNDREAKNRIRRDFIQLQGSRVSNGFTRQDISVLYAALQQVQAAKRNVRGGVATTRENRRYVEDRL